MAKYWAKHFRNVIFTGMPASGKTTFCKIYALHSGRLYLDFDAYIESITKKPIHEIFAADGVEGFRALESKILRKLGARHNFAFSMGGGTLLKKDNFHFARKLGLIVYLKTPLEVLSQRIFHDIEKHSPAHIRPLFAECKTLEEVKIVVEKLYAERESSYEKADVILDSTYNSQDALKMQLELVERRVRNKDYMRDVFKIMTDKNQHHTQQKEANDAGNSKE